MISALDTKILEVIENDEEIEAEVIQTVSLISMAKAKITSHLSSNAPAGKTALSTHMTLSPSTEHHDVEHERITRLPQLYLPHLLITHCFGSP